MTEKNKSVLGFFALRLPMLATAIIIAMILLIVGNFLVAGAPSLTWEFLTKPPENMNTEGGIFPAIYGTMLLVLIMTVVAVPVGTITAIYLTEYARQHSWFARTIRFAVNTLAGVPSIVFGLFGLGFFINAVGGSIDEARWNSKLDLLREELHAPASPVSRGRNAPVRDVTAYLHEKSEYEWGDQEILLEQFHGGTETIVSIENVVDYLQPHTELLWKKPSLIWAALTLALLTLPVVIVSVEESLRTVPRDIREASLSLGATKWETIRKIVVPNSLTGILTGSILAISRGAGEVAPILLTGVVYSMQELPTSPNDQFMHLGYHLYILATQSVDVEATRPLQYATTIVLLGLTLALNLVAIILRSRIRKRRIV